MFNLIPKFKDIGLRSKFSICLLFLVVIPLVVSALIMSFKASQVISMKAKEIALQSLKQTRISIQNLISETESISLTILSDATVQDLVKKYSINKSGESETFNDVDMIKRSLYFSLQSILSSKEYINSICLSNDSQIFFQYGDSVYTENSNYSESARKLNGKPFWTSVYTLENTVKQQVPRHVISLIRAVIDINKYGNQIAIERISIDEEVLARFYKDLNVYEGGNIFILDSQGSVISASRKDMLGHTIEDKGMFEEILRTKQEDGFFTSLVNGKDSTVLFYYLPNPGWYIVQTIPEKEFNKQWYLIVVFITITITFCVMFGIFFFFVLYRAVVIPLRLLSFEMKKVIEGNFNIDLRIKSKDEIGSLSSLFVNMTVRLKELIERVYISQLREREAQLKAMEAQINPHFLYNTLDSIHWLAVKNRDYEVSDQIEALSDIFKHVLNKGTDITTVREELEFLKSYMYIQKCRFGEKIELEITAEEELLDVLTPKMILQPLVENAIYHGLEPKIGKGKITIRVGKNAEGILFEVTDDGVGTDQNRIEKMLESNEESKDIFALKNINDRIKIKFGKEYGLKFFSVRNQGTKVEVLIPLL